MNLTHRFAIAALFFAAVSTAFCGRTSFVGATFSFGTNQSKGSVIAVTATNLYSDDTGCGFEPGANIITSSKGACSTNPFYFSALLPEGNYLVHVVGGVQAGVSTVSVRGDLRRLMLEKIHTTADASTQRVFIVNLRRPQLPGGKHVHLKPRESASEIWDWDDKLTLEFNGTRPAVASLLIEPTSVPVVYLIGDSTVCDQPAEPWNSWGQMLPRFFKPDISVANHAESGETVADSLNALRFEKIFSLVKPGDYLLVQFGHNDMKSKATNALDLYSANLKKVIARARSLGVTPVLVTSMERKNGVDHDTLAGYPDAVRAVAKSENCALIDLNAMSRPFYRALGADIGKAFQDGTHHNNYGSYELAKCVVHGIKLAKLPLAASIVDDFGDFDPSHPDPVATFEMPASPVADTTKPLGN